MREQAALTLGALKSEDATTSLFQALIDNDEHVRYAAGIALGKIFAFICAALDFIC